MICFKDRTFCSSDCTKSDCYRYFGDQQRADAIKWWGSEGAPVAFSDYSKVCPEYQKG